MKRLAPLALLATAFGCGTPQPQTKATPTPDSAPVLAPPMRTVQAPTAVAMLEPYLVAVVPAVASPSLPPTLRGGFSSPPPPSLDLDPLAPANPPPAASEGTAPTAPSPSPSPKPSSPSSKPNLSALVRLLEQERAQNVEAAQRALDTAQTAADASAAEAKRQWSYVKEGFVAQKKAEEADARTKSAQAEAARAQKELEDAQGRKRNARRDVERALVAVEAPEGRLAALESPLPVYRPVPYTYRLSIVGTLKGDPTVTGGTLGRALPTTKAETGAWIVRTASPSALKVSLGETLLTLGVHDLPAPAPSKRGA